MEVLKFQVVRNLRKFKIVKFQNDFQSSKVIMLQSFEHQTGSKCENYIFQNLKFLSVEVLSEVSNLNISPFPKLVYCHWLAPLSSTFYFEEFLRWGIVLSLDAVFLRSEGVAFLSERAGIEGPRCLDGVFCLAIGQLLKGRLLLKIRCLGVKHYH